MAIAIVEIRIPGPAEFILKNKYGELEDGINISIDKAHIPDDPRDDDFVLLKLVGVRDEKN